MGRFGRPGSLIHRAIPVLILVIGAGLSLLVFVEAQRVDDQKVLAAFDLRAQFRTNTIQDRLLDATVPVESLATFIATQKILDPDEFHGFAIQARGTDPIFHLTWAPRVTNDQRADYEAKVRSKDGLPDYSILERDATGRFVPAGERSEYYPVQFEERFEDPVTLSGFDHLSGENRRVAAEHARDVGEPTATPVVRLLPGETTGDRIILFWPVYSGGRIPDSVEGRRAAIVGFTTGAFRLDDVVDFAVHKLPPVAATLSVYYGQAPEVANGVPAVQNDLAVGKTRAGKEPLGKPDPDGLRLTKSFYEFGQTWTLVFDYSPQVVAATRSPASWEYGGLGLLLTLALAAYAYSQQRRQSVVEALVAERTHELNRSTAQIRGIVDSSDDAIIGKTLDGIVTSWNKGAVRIFGFSAEEMVGHPISAIAVPGREDDLTTILQKIRRGERVEHYETQRRRKNGTVIDISLTVSPIFDANGTIVGASKIARDITEKKAAEEALRRNREHLERVQSIARIGSTEVDLGTGEVIWSDEIYRLLRIDHDAIDPGVNSFAEAVHPEDREVLRDASLKGRKGQEVAPLEFRVVGSDGQIRWFYRTADFVRDAEGNPTRLIATMYDITERKAAEETSRESQQRFVAIFRDSPAGIVITDIAAGGKIVEANDAWLKTSGFTRDEVIGRTSSELNLWADPFGRNEVYRTLSRPEATWASEVRVRRKNGTIIDYATTMRQIEIAGRPHLIALGFDVSERKCAEMALRHSEEHLARVQAVARIGSIEVDLATQEATWSDEMFSLLGLDPKTTSPSVDTFTAAIHPDDRAIVRELSVRGRRGEETAPQEFRVVRADGAIGWLYHVSVIVRDGDGKPVRHVATMYDITERKAAEAHRVHLEKQLQQSQKMEAIGQLTGGVAHDFNNLLMVMLGNLELIQEQIGEDHKAGSLIADALGAGKSGSDLTYRLLAFSRRQALEPETTDINGRIVGFAPLIRRAIGEAIEIRQQLAESVWPVTIDPSQFDSALLNLAVNARDAMPNGGWIEISSENVTVDEAYAAQHIELAAGDYVRVAVADSGMGMPPKVLARAFEPFFTTKEVGKGTGLGLSMVYGFIKQSGGNVTIYSEVGKGTVIRLLLPRATQDADTGTLTAPPGDTVSTSDVNVLVVEDDVKVRKVTVAFLASLGYGTLDAGTGDEALALLATHPEIVLLLSDVILAGGETGPAVAARARQIRPDLKVMFASGYTEDALERNGHLDADVILLRKPFTKSALSTKVREALDRVPGGKT